MSRLGLRSVALGYLLVVLLGPVSMVFWKTFERGFGPFAVAAGFVLLFELLSSAINPCA